MPAASGTLITAPDKTKVKMRFHEQYVSQGTNKRLDGVGHGVMRGFRLGQSALPMTVELEVDPNELDSVLSFIDLNGVRLTYRETSVLSLDLTAAASTTVFVAAYIDYTISTETVIQWRTYTAAQLAAEIERVLIVGRVVVPAAGIIAAASITPLGREVAWRKTPRGVREWYQWIENGGFEVGFGGVGIVVPLSPDENWLPGWDIENATGVNVTWRIEHVAPAPRTGANELRCTVTAGGGTGGIFPYGGRKSVIPGQHIHLSMWVRGDVAPVANANGGIGFSVLYYDSDLQFVSSTDLIELLSGTFAYRELEGVLEVPSGVEFCRIKLIYDAQGSMDDGDFYIDDVRAWFEIGGDLDDSTRRDVGYEQSVRVRELDIVPVDGDYADMIEFISKAIMIRQNAIAGGVLQPVMQARDEGTDPFDFLLRNGGLEIDRVINSLGANLIATEADLETPRILTPMGASGVDRLTLLWEATNPVGTEGNIRIYAGTGASGMSKGDVALIFTINASWDETTLKWYRDSADDSYMWSISDAGINSTFYLSTDADGWSWSATSSQGRITTIGAQDSGGAPNIAMSMELASAYFQFYNPGLNDRDWHSTGPTTYFKNALSSRNIINSWCRVIGNSPGTSNRYGLTPSNIAGPPDDMRFTFDDAYGAITQYGVIAQVSSPGVAPVSYFPNVFNPGLGSFDIRIYDDAGAHVDIDTALIVLMVIVVGAYAVSP